MMMTMKTRFWVYSGDRPSNGAKALAAEDGFLRLRTNRLHKVKPTDVVINWGTTATITNDAIKPNVNHAKVLNFPLFVEQASNKLFAFQDFMKYGVKCVEWTDDQAIAADWSVDHVVVARKKLTGHSGDGIVIIEKGTPLAQWTEAPLYTKYVWKEKEFRVHVVNGVAIDTQRKIKDPDREVVNWKVRSHDNGFIFARNNIAHDPARDCLAIAAIEALGLNFGAVDIIEDKKGILYVLEVNTAPGLEGQTIDNYALAFRSHANGG